MTTTKKILQKQALAKLIPAGLKLGLTRKQVKEKVLKMSIPRLKESLK